MRNTSLPLVVTWTLVLALAWLAFSAEPASRPAATPSPSASARSSSRPAASRPSSQPATAAAADVPAVWKEMFPQGLIDSNGAPADLARLKGKIVGLYFSAHWCPPCRTFTPDLVKFRDKHAADFEIVFVSSDRTKEEQRKYMAESEMKWLAVEWRSEPAAAIQKKYEVRAIPTLVILGPDGQELTRRGRIDVATDPDHALADWKSKLPK